MGINLDLIPKITTETNTFHEPKHGAFKTFSNQLHPSIWSRQWLPFWCDSRLKQDWDLSKKTKSTGWSRWCIWLVHIDLTVVGNYLRLAGCAVWNSNNESEKTSVPLHPHPGAMVEKNPGFVSIFCQQASTPSSLGAIIELYLQSKFKHLEGFLYHNFNTVP